MVQAGTALSSTLIGRLAGLGVETLVVAADPSTDSAGPGSLEERVRQVEVRFTGHEHDAWMMALKALVIGQLTPGRRDDA